MRGDSQGSKARREDLFFLLFQRLPAVAATLRLARSQGKIFEKILYKVWTLNLLVLHDEISPQNIVATEYS